MCFSRWSMHNRPAHDLLTRFLASLVLLRQVSELVDDGVLARVVEEGTEDAVVDANHFGSGHEGEGLALAFPLRPDPGLLLAGDAEQRVLPGSSDHHLLAVQGEAIVAGVLQLAALHRGHVRVREGRRVLTFGNLDARLGWLVVARLCALDVEFGVTTLGAVD